MARTQQCQQVTSQRDHQGNILLVEFVEVPQKFAFQCPAHILQLFLDLAPYSFYRVRVGPCERVNRWMDVAETVQNEVQGKFCQR